MKVSGIIRNLCLCTALACVGLSATACQTPPPPALQPPRHYTFTGVFDTVSTILSTEPDEAVFDERARFIEQRLMHYHRLFDIYHSYEGIINLKTVNDRAGTGPVVVDEALFELLKLGKTWAQKTQGRLNIAMGPVLKIWHDFREAVSEAKPSEHQPELPSRELLEAARQQVRIEGLVLNEANHSVELLYPQLRLDVGAIAKGWATEQVAQEIQKKGWNHYILNIGGNVRTLGGRDEQATPWRVAVQNPNHKDPQTFLKVLALKGQSMVTSGSYERFVEVNGATYSHIIDPGTLYPATRYTSLTVLAPDSALGDLLSTTLFILNLEDGQAFLKQFPGAEALWVLPNGQQYETPGFHAAVVKDYSDQTQPPTQPSPSQVSPPAEPVQQPSPSP